MFTGIVEELGTVVAVEPLTEAARVTIEGPVVTDGTGTGDSVAVNGVCLTALPAGTGRFSADVMAETLRRSSLGGLRPGDRVNLERPLRLADRLGGHVVHGHVDGVGTVLDRSVAEHWTVVRISLPAGLGRYVVEKGSIGVDGVSLTVAAVDPAGPAGAFTVSLIPTTLARTTLGSREPGDRVNLEVDVMAKYVERLLAAGATPGRRPEKAVGGEDR